MVFKGKWFFLALIAMILAVFIDASKKYILDKNMIKPNELIIYCTILIGIFATCHYFYDKKCRPIYKINKKLLLLLLLIGMCGYFFTIVFVHSIDLAPDVTLPAMIVSLNIILMYLISSIFFEHSPKFNVDVFFGLLLIVFGINIISKKF